MKIYPAIDILDGRAVRLKQGRKHEVTVYEASPYPGFDPLVRTVGLGEFSAEHVTALSTLYVPPLKPAPVDLTMLDRLGLPRP